MSNNNATEYEISRELIEKSMRQARIERSKAVWAILQRLFSRPESADDANVVNGSKIGFRLG